MLSLFHDVWRCIKRLIPKCLSKLFHSSRWCFPRIACLGNIRCALKRLSMVLSCLSENNFQLSKKKTFQFIRLYWNIIKCEKLILSLNNFLLTIATSCCIYVMGSDNWCRKRSANILWNKTIHCWRFRDKIIGSSVKPMSCVLISST